MCSLSNSARSDSDSQEPSETGDIGDAFTRKDYYQELIDLASTVPLLKVFKYYGSHCNEGQPIIRCPFKSHKGGRENTASFKYYHETNSFCCFGCHIGGPFAHAPHFVAAMDGISLANAAGKVLDVFKDNIGDIGDVSFMSPADLDLQLAIMMDFSNAVRDFYQTNSSEKARVYIEWICEAFDALNLKHENLDNEALAKTVKNLKEFIGLYKP